MAHDYVHGSAIRQGVIMMCTPDLYYQEFRITDHELRSYKHKFLKRLDMYHELKFDEKEQHNTEKEKRALKDLVDRLKDCKEQMSPEAIQTIIYSVGKDNGYKENLREWFKAIYEIVFGDEEDRKSVV